MRFLIVVLISCFCQGCVAISSMLNVTHTEREILSGHWFIVVDKIEYKNWITEFKQNAELKIINEDENFILAVDNYGKDSGKLWIVSYQIFTHNFCSEIENIKKSPEYKEKLKNNGLVIKSIDSTSLNNCKNSYQTPFRLVNEDGSYRGEFSAMIVLDIEMTSELKYRFVPAGSYCLDGTISSSVGRGTCSWHGGVSGPYYRKEYLH